VIAKLGTRGSTNLIDAIGLALQQASHDVITTNIQIVLLTDGEPDDARNVLPRFRTQIKPLENARAAGRHHGICLSTFGFGFAMNSVSMHLMHLMHLMMMYLVHHVLLLPRTIVMRCCRSCCWR
jgi:hypothetical protein